jgi:hypothetical protein
MNYLSQKLSIVTHNLGKLSLTGALLKVDYEFEWW